VEEYVEASEFGYLTTQVPNGVSLIYQVERPAIPLLSEDSDVVSNVEAVKFSDLVGTHGLESDCCRITVGDTSFYHHQWPGLPNEQIQAMGGPCLHGEVRRVFELCFSASRFQPPFDLSEFSFTRRQHCLIDGWEKRSDQCDSVRKHWGYLTQLLKGRPAVKASQICR
jgi:hypothetical protein